jgi:predicted dehydrogenase
MIVQYFLEVRVVSPLPVAIGVGIVGGSVSGWAALGHIPALRALPGYELRAVSASRRASAATSVRQHPTGTAISEVD